VEKFELEVYTFGRCVVRVTSGSKSRNVPCSHKKGFGILFLTALSKGPVSVNNIATRLWEELDVKSVLSNFYANLHLLRQDLKLPSEAIHVKNGQVQLDVSSVFLDYRYFLDKFEEAFASGNSEKEHKLIEAKCIYQGDFLPDFYDEEWTVSFRESARDRYISILEELAKIYTVSFRHDKALEAAREILSLDPYNERGHFWKCVNYTKLGRVGKAKKHYKDAYERFRQELGMGLSFSFKDVLHWNPSEDSQGASTVSEEELIEYLNTAKVPILYIDMVLSHNHLNPSLLSRLFRIGDILSINDRNIKVILRGVSKESAKKMVERVSTRICEGFECKVVRIDWKHKE